MAGLFGVLPAGLVALVLLRREKRDIDAGIAPRGSKTLIGGLLPITAISVAIWGLLYALALWPRT